MILNLNKGSIFSLKIFFNVMVFLLPLLPPEVGSVWEK